MVAVTHHASASASAIRRSRTEYTGRLASACTLSLAPLLESRPLSLNWPQPIMYSTHHRRPQKSDDWLEQEPSDYFKARHRPAEAPLNPGPRSLIMTHEEATYVRIPSTRDAHRKTRDDDLRLCTRPCVRIPMSFHSA